MTAALWAALDAAWALLYALTLADSRRSPRRTAALAAVFAAALLPLEADLAMRLSQRAAQIYGGLLCDLPLLLFVSMLSRKPWLRSLFASATASATRLAVGGLTTAALIVTGSPLWAAAVRLAAYLLYYLFLRLCVRPRLQAAVRYLTAGRLWTALTPVCFALAFFTLSIWPGGDALGYAGAVAQCALTLAFGCSYAALQSGWAQLEREAAHSTLQLQTGIFRQQEHDMVQESQRRRILRHDARHYLHMAEQYLSSGQVEDGRAILERLDELLTQDGQDARLAVYCPAPALNNVLRYHLSLAQEQGVEVAARVNLPGRLPADEVELAVVLSNALENARNALAALPPGSPRRLDVRLRPVQGQLLLEVENTCAAPPPLNPLTGLPMTEATGHGLGVRSMQAFARKYGAQLQFTVQDGVFRLRLLLPPMDP